MLVGQRNGGEHTVRIETTLRRFQPGTVAAVSILGLLNRAYRKKANLPIQQAERASDPDSEVLVEPRLKPPGLRTIKYPDQRLGEYVANRLSRRVRKGTDTADSVQSKIDRISDTLRRHTER